MGVRNRIYLANRDKVMVPFILNLLHTMWLILLHINNQIKAEQVGWVCRRQNEIKPLCPSPFAGTRSGALPLLSACPGPPHSSSVCVSPLWSCFPVLFPVHLPGVQEISYPSFQTTPSGQRMQCEGCVICQDLGGKKCIFSVSLSCPLCFSVSVLSRQLGPFFFPLNPYAYPLCSVFSIHHSYTL